MVDDAGLARVQAGMRGSVPKLLLTRVRVQWTTANVLSLLYSGRNKPSCLGSVAAGVPHVLPFVLSVRIRPVRKLQDLRVLSAHSWH